MRKNIEDAVSVSLGMMLKMRMYSFLDLITEIEPKSEWLVIGDVRSEGAGYLANRGAKALPTDIDIKILESMKEKGLIQEYGKENAENLSFKNESFDFVFSKDSFHHFSRPYLGIYEMFRVAKKGIVLIEPQDWSGKGAVAEIFSKIRNFIRKLIGRQDINFTYESVGNFVFRLSLKEIEKISMALNYRVLIWKESNDFCCDKIFHLHPNSFLSFVYIVLVWMSNLFVKIGAASTTLSVCVLKEDLSDEQMGIIKKKGVKMKRLPRNPFLEDQE